MRLKTGKIDLLALTLIAALGFVLAACQPKSAQDNSQPKVDAQNSASDLANQIPDSSDVKLTP